MKSYQIAIILITITLFVLIHGIKLSCRVTSTEGTMPGHMSEIAKEQVREMAKTRPGRAYLRDQVDRWKEKAVALREEALSLDELASLAAALNEEYRSGNETRGPKPEADDDPQDGEQEDVPDGRSP